jgi:hypothetical protein
MPGATERIRRHVANAFPLADILKNTSMLNKGNRK